MDEVRRQLQHHLTTKAYLSCRSGEHILERQERLPMVKRAQKYCFDYEYLQVVCATTKYAKY